VSGCRKLAIILAFLVSFSAGCLGTPQRQPAGTGDAVPDPRWVRTTSKYGSSNTWSSPFQANICCKKGPEGVEIGEDVEVTLLLHNVTSIPSSKEAPRTLEVKEYSPTVAIFPALGSIDSPIWEETLSSLSGVLEPGDGYELKYAWKQVDSSGGQVPPGYYYVELKSGSIRYREEGRERIQSLEWSMHTSHSEVRVNHPEGTTVSGVWRINRSVTKSGVTISFRLSPLAMLGADSCGDRWVLTSHPAGRRAVLSPRFGNRGSFRSPGGQQRFTLKYI